VPLQRLVGQQLLDGRQVPRVIGIKTLGVLDGGRCRVAGEEGQAVADGQKGRQHGPWRVTPPGGAAVRRRHFSHQHRPLGVAEGQSRNIGHLQRGRLGVFAQFDTEQIGQVLVRGERQ